MSRHDSELSLHQMLDHAREAMTLSKGKSSAELIDDRVLALALVRLMEIVGEAANRVPKEEQSRHSEIPWTQITGLRNRLIHGYDAIDYEVLWHILNRDLPGLVFSLEEYWARILSKLKMMKFRAEQPQDEYGLEGRANASFGDNIYFMAQQIFQILP